MRIDDSLAHATRAIAAQPLRAALILLAMSIGVAAVTLLTALGESARVYVVNQFQALGTHLVIVLPGRNETTGGHPPLFGETPRDLTLGDAEALRRSPHVAELAPVIIGSAPVSVFGLERETTIIGSTSALQRVRRLNVAQGRFLPLAASDQQSPVCVIGQTIRDELFGRKPALGQWLRLGDRRFRVVGILASEGESLGMNFDKMVVIAVASAQALFDVDSLFRIVVEAKSEADMHAAVDNIRAIIKSRHEGEDDVTIITQDSVVSTFDDILRALTMTVGSITGISLGVAGILVMNVMLVSVAQRTEEIGLLKALGATRRQVRGLFLLEAALLSVAGALFGVAAGEMAIIALQISYPDFPLVVPWWALLAALSTALVTGLVFGVLPASKAAKLNPIQALTRK
ncbi:MAG: ABC transporter permease [Gammaproteobacteria bacterium]